MQEIHSLIGHCLHMNSVKFHVHFERFISKLQIRAIDFGRDAKSLVFVERFPFLDPTPLILRLKSAFFYFYQQNLISYFQNKIYLFLPNLTSACTEILECH